MGLISHLTPPDKELQVVTSLLTWPGVGVMSEGFATGDLALYCKIEGIWRITCVCKHFVLMSLLFTMYVCWNGNSPHGEILLF